MLPQVLAGLGAASIISTGCVLWLERLRPLFAFAAVVSIVYQSWLLWRRPAAARTRTMLIIWWASVVTIAAIAGGLWALSLHYR